MVVHAPNKICDMRLMVDKGLRIALALAILCIVSAFPAAAAIQRVNVAGGTLEGRIDAGVASFKGVPFAAPPIGELRWKAPQAVIPWSGIKRAESFALPCAQPQHDGIPDSSEDCLYLNVWTGAKSSQERRPVMVWIYGEPSWAERPPFRFMTAGVLRSRELCWLALHIVSGPLGF